VVLPTDVLLKSTSYEGSLIGRLDQLHSDWIFSWPEVGDAPFMEMPALLAGEEFDALVFNSAHGWYRQALGCLRNALETLTSAAACAVSNNAQLFDEWQAGRKELRFGSGRAVLRDSSIGTQIDADCSASQIFGDDGSSWMKSRYNQLCSYAHSEGGYNNADFWASNGPVFVPSALETIEAEFRETLALCYLLLRIGWSGYQVGPGQPALLRRSRATWAKYEDVLEKWLL
jgi:hypothetical protein